MWGRKELEKIFKELDECVQVENRKRVAAGGLSLSKSEVTLLGQMSLLANDQLAFILELAQTNDMDAYIKMEWFVKNALQRILNKNGMIYDQDSYLIQSPPGAIFEKLFDFPNVRVLTIDVESALVSKAVKAPAKNKQLIRQAIASGRFPNLINRIKMNGGNLDLFKEE